MSKMIMPVQMMFFGRASKYNGTNDMIRQERHQARKYGMKRHFYDKVKLDPSALPTEQ
jgi:hypothetical protein